MGDPFSGPKISQVLVRTTPEIRAALEKAVRHHSSRMGPTAERYIIEGLIKEGFLASGRKP